MTTSPPRSVIRARQFISELDDFIRDSNVQSIPNPLQEALALQRSAIHSLVGIANLLETNDELRRSDSIRANNGTIENLFKRITSANHDDADLYESAREPVDLSDVGSDTCELAPFVPAVEGDPSDDDSLVSSSEEGRGWSDEEAEAFEKFEEALQKKQHCKDDKVVATRE